MATVEARLRARAAWEKRKIDGGICRSCSRPRVPGKTRCSDCLKSECAKSKQRYLRTLEESRRKAREWRRLKRARDPEGEREYKRKLYLRYPDRFKNYDMQRRYGITLDQYNALVKKQHGLCAICGEVPTIGKRAAGKEKQPPRLCIDHDHKTGKVRGLLCHWCNTNIIAGIEKSGASLQSIFQYLRR